MRNMRIATILSNNFLKIIYRDERSCGSIFNSRYIRILPTNNIKIKFKVNNEILKKNAVFWFG